MNTARSEKYTDGRAALALKLNLAAAGLISVCLAASLALVLEHFGQWQLPGCGPRSGCAAAAAGPWGSIAGWPVSFLGMAYFAGLLAGLLSRDRRATPASFRNLVRAGGLASVLYVTVMIAAGYTCVYCATIHAANLAFWILAEARDRLVVERRRREETALAILKPAITLVAVFALVSAALNVARSEHQRLTAYRAEQQLQRSLEALADTRPGLEPSGAADSSGQNVKDESQAPATLSGASSAVAAAETVAATDSAARDSAAQPHRLGPERAAIRLEIFLDYQCQHCQRIDTQVQALWQQYAELMSISIRHYPLCMDCNYSQQVNTHPHACRAARAAETAGVLKGSEGFWRMHTWLFQRLGEFTDEELRAALLQQGFNDPKLFFETMEGKQPLRRILSDIVEAEARDIRGTPFIFINGVMLRGWEAENALVRAVQTTLEHRPREGATFSPTNFAGAADGFPNELVASATWATVRVLADGGKATKGSGVVVGVREPFIYILTAAHVVRNANRLAVQTFDAHSYPQPAQIYSPVQVLAQRDDLDLAILRVTGKSAVSSLPICPVRDVPTEVGFQGLTVGCNGDQPPTALATTVESKKVVRRTADGAPVAMWEVVPEPAKGRSGGALINGRGYVIGIGSGTSTGKGYYAHVDDARKMLEQAALGWLCDESGDRP